MKKTIVLVTLLLLATAMGMGAADRFSTVAVTPTVSLTANSLLS